MAIDFHSRRNRSTYTGRQADASWVEAIRRIVDPAGKRVADIGCGGGIYSQAWHELGAEVVGVDFSDQMVSAAREQAAGLSRISFRQGDATATGLPTASSNVVFERALIHHLKDCRACFAEARRVLVPGGNLIVQDRTPDDVQLPGSPEHVRGYFFERFPRLLAPVELARRPTDAAVRDALQATGFHNVKSVTLWELRKTHDGREGLKQDLTSRTGRSILHDLSDKELAELILYIEKQLSSDGPIVEKDRWTVWSAVA